MKTIVTYFSRSGNTKKVAEAIFDGVATQKDLKEIGEVSSLDGYDLAFVGFPINAFGPAKEAKDFLTGYCQGKRIALFVTHATPEDAPEWVPFKAACLEAASGANVVGFFDCQGQLASNVKELMLKSDRADLRNWAQMDNSQGQPDARRLERARAFGKDLTSATK